MNDDSAVAIARTDDTSRVFRADRQTVVAVTDESGQRQTRFVGLLATNAYRVSVLDIPGVGPAVADALDLTSGRVHTHTGRATRTVLENLPRDLVFELEPSALARLVAAIVGLQERQVVRVFEVPEPVGPWITVLVYVPRSRFTAELPERVADAVTAAYSAERRMFESHVGASSLARIAVSVRSPDGQRRTDLETLERTIDELSTSWRDRLRSALTAELGEDRGRALFDRVGEHAPPAYRAAVAPDRAISDVRRIASLIASDVELTTALGHDVDAPPGEWRFRVYRQGQPAALSALLPLLDHLGLQALDERPYTFRIDDEQVFLYDIGVRVGGAVELDEARRSALQDAFASLVAGDIESDGYNRLVLQAGLSAREVAMIRAYGKYLRQIGFAFSQSYIEDVLCAHPRLVADLVELFHARFDPSRDAGDVGRAARRGERRGAGTTRGVARRHPLARRRPHLPGVPDVDRRHRAHELLPPSPGDRLQARPDGDPRPAAAPAASRDLGVRAPGRGGPPPRRRHRPWRPALERPPRGLPHRGARPDEGADGEERRHRADRRKGRVRRQAPAGESGGAARRGRATATGRSSPGCSTSPTTSSRPTAGERRRSSTRRTPSSTTATTPTSSSPPTRARRRSATSPTRSPRSTASGSAMPSPRVAAPATTTRRWASPPAEPGRACAVTPACSARTPRPIR